MIIIIINRRELKDNRLFVSKQGHYMKVNGLMIKNMETEFLFKIMVINTQENFVKIRETEKEL